MMVWYLYFCKFKLFFKKKIMFWKNILKIFTFITLFFVALSAFADKGFKIDKVTGDTVSFSWTKDEKTPYFEIHYWEKSSTDGTYAKQTDIIEKYNFDVKWLESNKTYYFALVWYSKEWKKSFTTKEISQKIWSDGKSAGFSLKKIVQTGKKEITLTFSEEISTKKDTKQNRFKVESVANPSDYFEVVENKIDEKDPKSLVLTLDSEPKIGSEYKVIVISVEDKNGNNIEYGVDSENTFTWINVTELNAAGPALTKTEKPAKTEPVKQEPKPTASATKSGKDLKASELKKDIKWTSEKTEDLPKTWPAHILLLLIALIVSWIVFLPKYLKN